MLSFIMKFIVNRKEVIGTSFPRSFVCCPYPLKTDIKGLFTRLGCVGSSQLTGMVVFVRREQTYAPNDWETTCNPSNLLMTCNAVDFPLAVSPIAVATGQQPKIIK